MKLVALTMDLSPSNFIGLGIGTKVSVISKEQFYKELNTPLFRGVYINPSKLQVLDESVLDVQKTSFMYTIGRGLNIEILQKIVFVQQVFNWTPAYDVLYYVEYNDVPNTITPPAYMRIEKLSYELPLTD